PAWDSPLRPIGGLHHVLGMAPPAPGRDVYRGLGRIVANATAAMNVTAPTAPMEYFFEHHGATMVFFVHEGRGTLETTFGPIEDVRPLTADRSHVPPSGHTIFTLPGCYLCVFTVRSVEKDAMWVPVFHKNLDYLETLGYHWGEFFSAGGVVGPGMVTLHPVGLPHGPKPKSLEAFMDGANAGVHKEVGIMADFANPTQV